jgi:hypothetical protein
MMFAGSRGSGSLRISVLSGNEKVPAQKDRPATGPTPANHTPLNANLSSNTNLRTSTQVPASDQPPTSVPPSARVWLRLRPVSVGPLLSLHDASRPRTPSNHLLAGSKPRLRDRLFTIEDSSPAALITRTSPWCSFHVVPSAAMAPRMAAYGQDSSS